MGTIKDKNGVDLTEAEGIKKRWQEYTELYKEDLHDPDNHNGVITHLEPDIPECEVTWAFGNITMNKTSGGNTIPVELFQILKMMLWKCCTQYASKLGKLYSGPKLGKVSFHSNLKERQSQRMFKLPHNCTQSQASCIMSPCLFNLYAEYIMWNAGLDEAQAGIMIVRRNINNLRYADDTTLTAESEELKSLVMKGKEESEKVGLKLNIQKTIMGSGSISSWQIKRETMETVRDFLCMGSKITAMVIAVMKLKDACSLEEKLWPT